MIEKVKVKHCDRSLEAVEYILAIEWWGTDMECDADSTKKVEHTEDYAGEIPDVAASLATKPGPPAVPENIAEGSTYTSATNDDPHEHSELNTVPAGCCYYYTP